MNIFEQLSSKNEESKWEDSLPKTSSQQSTKFSSLGSELDIGQDIQQDGVPKRNIFEQLADQEKKRLENQFGFLDYAKDIAQQVPKKLASGATGAYGNILETFGAQIPEGKNLPGQEQIYNIQSQLLDKLQRGEKLSFGEYMLLSDDDIVPGMRLPTSKEVDRGIESVTGIGEGKTAPGRIAGRAAEFVGEGAATGGNLKTLASMGLGGLAGQGVREAGGPELLASGLEIGASLAPSVITSKLNPLSKAAKDTVEAGRKLGLTEKQIAPLIQSERKLATLPKVARKPERTKNQFKSIKDALGDSYDRIKSAPQAKNKLSRSEQVNLRNRFGDILDDLSKTLAPSPDKQAAIDYIEKSLKTLRKVDITPEYLVNFWQDINKSVKWNSIEGGKKSLAKLKDPIADTLKKVSPQLAEDFDLTNKLYSKYSEISKKLKPNLVDAFVSKGEMLSIAPSAFALMNGNPWAMYSLASEATIRTLANEMLTNPYFQTIAGKLVNNFNSGSVKAIETVVNQAQEFLERKYPNEDWSFLTTPLE